MTALDAANSTLVDGIGPSDLDHLLTAQFAIAWAGEGGDDPRDVQLRASGWDS